MDPLDDPEVALDIPLDSIYEEFCCPICYGPIQQCMMTPCGHNFCSACITECFNIKHKCPCCNKSTTTDKLVRNHHFDKLIEIITKEKAIASKAYFDRLLRKPDLRQTGEIEKSAAPTEFSPIEQLFHKHMKRSLVSYEDYYQEIAGKFQAQCDAVHADSTQKLTSRSDKLAKQKRRIARGASSKTLEQVQTRYDSKSKQIQEDCSRRLALLEESFTESVRLLCDVYDEYMQNLVPAKEFLPVVISVIVQPKGTLLRNVTVSRTDALEDLRPVIERRLAELGDPISNWGASPVFSLSDPLSGGEEVRVQDEKLPLVQYGAQQGSQLTITGGIVLTSEKPKTCFTATYKKGNTTNYYTCKDCNINWVCEDCATECHKGHTIVDYLKQHTPTWNCCYCVKRKKCTLPNKSNKSKA